MAGNSEWNLYQWIRSATWLKSIQWAPKSTLTTTGAKVWRGLGSTVLCLGTLVCGYLVMTLTTNLVLVIWHMLRGAHLPSLITAEHIVNLTTGPVEVLILLRMLSLDHSNHKLYKDFFRARTEYYDRRYRKAKPPEELPGGDMLDVVVEDVPDA